MRRGGVHRGEAALRGGGAGPLCLLLLATALAAIPSGAAARQASEGARRALVVNTVVSGLGAGLFALTQDRSFWKAALGGALGGATVSWGKRVVAGDDHSGFWGRELAALGSSITRNAMVGGGWLTTLTFPLGPLRVDLRPRTLPDSRVRLDLAEAGWLAYGLLDDQYTLDLDLTRRAGAFVFTSEEEIGEGAHARSVYGRTQAGSIFLWELGLANSRGTLQHEIVHIVQIDQMKIAAGIPLERAAWSGLGWSDRPPLRWMDVGFAHLPLQYALTGWLENEAYALTGR